MAIPKTFQYTITNVKVVGFFINENIVDKADKNKIRIQFNYKLSFDIESNILNFSFKTVYYYDDLTPNNPISFIEVENLFYIENLKAFLSENQEITLPNQLWLTIVSMSITHTRSLFCHFHGNTALNGTTIPVINPLDVTKAFFPHMVFDNPEKNKEITNTKD
jgi:hypothetical protein